jgi:hypothetical protein
MRPALALTSFSLLVPLALAGCPTDPDSFGRTDTETGGVEGSICAPTGLDGVRAVTVAVYPDEDEDGVADGDTPSATALTDVDGTFVFEDLAAGTYVGLATRGHLELTFPLVFGAGNRAQLNPVCFPPDSLAITQLGGSCDDPSGVLDGMGFDATTIATTGQEWLGLLTNASEMEDVDILLVPCGLPDDWRPQGPTISNVLFNWLGEGGSLYVSGSSFPLLELVDENLVDFFRDDGDPDEPAVGFGGTLQATVVDPGIGAYFSGGAASVRMPDNCVVAESVGDAATALVTATAQTVDFETVPDAVLVMTSTSEVRGTISYSAFGKTGESTAAMERILAEVLLSL